MHSSFSASWAAWSKRWVLDDCYHMVTLDRQRHLVVERSLDFVDRLIGAQASDVVTPMSKKASGK